MDGQFLHLQKLQDESTPDFVVEVVSIFFDETEKLLNDVTTALLGLRTEDLSFSISHFLFLDFVVHWVFLFSLNREQPSVDFRIIGGHVYRFKGSSSRYT